MRFGKRKKYRDHELAPDEIFLDSSNQPDFNTNQLEGRLEKPLSRTSFWGIALCALLVFGVLTAQAANLEILKGAKYALQSERNRLREQVIFGLSQKGGSEAANKLISIARTERDPELRGKAVFWLSQSEDPHVVQVLTEIVNK